MKPPNLIIIAGPTAVGKTDVGIELAKILDGEIISGDSMQVYKGMDIGTAKPTVEEMQGIPHHMIDVLRPDEDFSVAVFREMVEKCIQEITLRSKIPILVGGTGLYIRSIIDPYDFSPAAVDLELRDRLRSVIEREGNENLYETLKRFDPVSAERIHVNDTKRIIRALEVYYSTGKPISSFHRLQEELPTKYNLGYFGLFMDRQTLYKRIEHRVDLMTEKGLIEEVEGLLAKGYGEGLVSMQGIGYKEIIAYIKGDTSLEEAIALLKRNTRRFAKRQLTWFRRDSRIFWIDVGLFGNKSEIADKIAIRLEGQLIKM